MIVIYKYKLEWDAKWFATFEAPLGNLQEVARQHGSDYAWVEIQKESPDLPQVEYTFRMVMTGEELPNSFELEWEYVDTLFISWLVIHIFRKFLSYV